MNNPENKENKPILKMVIASGKGGTGKTTVAVNLALALSYSGKGVQLLDCDVEEPNAHLFLKPVIEKTSDVGIPVPQVDISKCNYCKYCAEICVFNALAVFPGHVMVLDQLCHGCGSCTYLCPEKALSEHKRTIGVVESGKAYDLFFVHGKLNPGEAMSPPLINAVKDLADPVRISIIDAPPGTSCPVVSAVNGSDYCILVTEPTPFGLNDLDLAYRMVKKLGIPAGVVINRCDIGDSAVEDYCFANGISVLQRIPYDRRLAELYARGEPVALALPQWREKFLELYEKVIRDQERILRL